MAGTSADFDASEFRTEIRAIMEASAAQAEACRVTFCWNTEKTFPNADSVGVPYDLTSTADTNTTQDPVQVPCAVEYAGASGEERTEGFGTIDTSKAKITVCDVDWDSVKDADYVTINNNPYVIDSAVELALFDFSVHEVHVHARGRA